jgi:type IV secretion system protein VirB9
MLVRTAAHSYIFELKVVASDWTALEQAKQAGVQYKITFKYPNNTEFTPKDEEVRQLTTSLDKGRTYNFDYDYSTRTKQLWFIPETVYDDGQFTYIKMRGMKQAPTGSFPVVFARERGKSEDFLVNTTVENNTMIVHGTYPYLVIRHGKNVIGLRRNTTK